MSGVHTGLDYTAVRTVAELLSIELTQDRFREIRDMEIAALDELGRRR